MEKYILITAEVIMIIILALDFIFSKDGYQCHSCKKRFHKEDLEIKGCHFKEWVCPNCKPSTSPSSLFVKVASIIYSEDSRRSNGPE